MIAQELLSNWMKSKLQLELMSDGEEEVDSVLEKPSAAPLKYERFDGESTTKQFLASFLRMCWGREPGLMALVRLRRKSCSEARIVGSVETRLEVMIFLPQLLQQLAVGPHKCAS